jgi:hypothetical protein
LWSTLLLNIRMAQLRRLEFEDRQAVKAYLQKAAEERARVRAAAERSSEPVLTTEAFWDTETEVAP